MVIKQELIDELLSDYKNPEDLLGDGGIFKELKKALLERALKAELGDHLGYEKSDPKGRKSGNSRNGHGAKKLTGEDGEMTISVPRDRNGASRVSMTRSYRCTRAACRCARSGVTWRSCMASACRRI